MDRKLIRSGSGWALFVPKTVLELLKVNPEADRVEYEIENRVLKISKAKNAESSKEL